MNEALNLEKAQQQQKKNEETLKELENTLGDVNRDVETIQERRAALKAEIHLLENDKSDIDNEIKNKEIKARERLIPEIERITKQIQEMNTEIASTQIRIEKEET
jgi:chromosome segregation ATPase